MQEQFSELSYPVHCFTGIFCRVRRDAPFVFLSLGKLTPDTQTTMNGLRL